MTRFMLIATYQYCENYGAHSWDGTGECPQYWKSKSSHEEVIAPNLSIQEVIDLGSVGAQELIAKSELGFYYGSDYCTYDIIDWEFVELTSELVERIRDYFNSSECCDHITDPYAYIDASCGLDISMMACKWAIEQITSNQTSVDVSFCIA